MACRKPALDLDGAAEGKKSDVKAAAQPESPEVESEKPPAADGAKSRPPPVSSETGAFAAAEDQQKLVQLSELSDVAPAGPATAFEGGVVIVTKDDQLFLAKRGPADSFTTVDLPSNRFARYARGPALAGDYAYWVSGSKLLRARLKPSAKSEQLASDARHSTRVAAVVAPAGKGQRGLHVAGYIAKAKDGNRLIARLWVESKQILTLSPEGSAATSVALSQDGTKVVALVLEGRSSMSPVHMRTLNVRGKIPLLSEDQVVWVGPPAQPLTELSSLTDGKKTFSLIPLERDVTTFGLAQFAVDSSTDTVRDVSWDIYPNGIDPAPVAASEVCGRPAVLHARPSTAKPRTPQELRLAFMQDRRLEPYQVVARSRAFSNVSLAAFRGGAVITWVADYRTWAVVAHCKK